MTDLRNCPREVILEFIELYKSKPCLWKTKCKEYSDRNARHDAYEILIKKLKKFIPDATKDTVVRKIDSLRKNFRKEFKKVEQSKKSTTGQRGNTNNSVYKPKLWYFNELMFLRDQEISQNNSNNASNIQKVDKLKVEQETHSEEEEEDEEEEQEEKEDDTNLMDNNNASASASVNDFNNSDSRGTRSPPSELYEIPCPLTNTYDQSSTNPLSNSLLSCTGNSINKSHRRARKRSLHEAVLLQLHHKLNTQNPDDEYDIIGKNIAMKLRKLPNKTKIIAEKLIMDILYQAGLGILNTKL